MSKKIIRVAIIDDDPVFLELAEHYLGCDETASFVVTSFVKPMDIYDHVQPFDVYVVDYNLGHVDGVHLILGMRGQIHPGPFILCSGVLTDQRIQEAVDAGVELVLEKPRDVAVLAQSVLSVVNAWRAKPKD